MFGFIKTLLLSLRAGSRAALILLLLGSLGLNLSMLALPAAAAVVSATLAAAGWATPHARSIAGAREVSAQLDETQRTLDARDRDLREAREREARHERRRTALQRRIERQAGVLATQATDLGRLRSSNTSLREAIRDHRGKLKSSITRRIALRSSRTGLMAVPLIGGFAGVAFAGADTLQDCRELQSLGADLEGEGDGETDRLTGTIDEACRSANESVDWALEMIPRHYMSEVNDLLGL